MPGGRNFTPSPHRWHRACGVIRSPHPEQPETKLAARGSGISHRASGFPGTARDEEDGGGVGGSFHLSNALVFLTRSFISPGDLHVAWAK